MILFPKPIGYESITVSNSAIGFTASYLALGATVAFISIETGNIRIREDGTNPTASEGHLLSTGEVQMIEGTVALQQLRMIRETIDATVKVTYYSHG